MNNITIKIPSRLPFLNSHKCTPRGIGKRSQFECKCNLITSSPLIHVRTETNDVSLAMRGSPRNKDTRITLKMSLKRDNTQTQTTCFVLIEE